MALDCCAGGSVEGYDIAGALLLLLGEPDAEVPVLGRCREVLSFPPGDGFVGVDRLTSITDNAGTISRTYSTFGAFKGALATENGPWANDTYTIHRLSSRLVDYATLEELNASGSPTTRTWTFEYDALNRLNELSGSAGTFTFDYAGPAGRLTTTHLPGGNVSITNFFDPAGQLLERSLRTAGGTALDYFGYTHDLTGLRTNVVRADNTHVEYLFDGIGQLTNAIAYEPSGGGLRRNENFAYAYDAGGNLQTRGNNTLTQSFGVDDANRLTTAGRSGTLTAAGSVNSSAVSVTVNSVGAELYVDKTFATTNGLTLNNGNNPLTFSAKNAANQTTSYTENFNLPTNVNYIYDLNGNLTSDGALGYDYDDADQLTRITKTNAWRSEFVYDALGRRNVRREFTWNSGLGTWNLTDEVRYVWTGMSLLQERDSNNAVKVTYTGKLARTDASGTAYYFSDGNQNVTSLIDSSGNFKAKYRYDSFGNLLSMSGPLADANLIRFSGKEYHPLSGLYYYGYRYYQPNLQRWLNGDPIGIAGGLNLYGFVGNNPIAFFDPYGLAWFDDLADRSQCEHKKFSEATLDTSGDGNHWLMVGTLNTVSEVVAGVLSFPQALSHLGTGSGTFSADPSLENAPGMLMDVGMAADVLAMGAVPLPGMRSPMTKPKPVPPSPVPELPPSPTTPKPAPSPPSPSACPVAVSSGLSDATLVVKDGVAKVKIGYVEESSMIDLAAKLEQLAEAAGASSIVMDTGVIVNENLAANLFARAQGGRTFLGGEVTSTGTATAPSFTITIRLE